MTSDHPGQRRPVANADEHGGRRGLARPPLRADEVAIERVMQRLGAMGEFTDAQIREIAAIALVAVSVDDADRQRRDETARENRRRLRSLGRD